MQLSKFTVVSVVALIIAAGTCRSEIVIDTSRLDKSTSRLVNDLVNIVTSCYGDRLNGIGLAGNLPGSLLKILTVNHSIPVALIDNIMDFNDDPPSVLVESLHKLPIFIIEASTFEYLDTLIGMNIKYSVWWNVMASFFILDLSPGCVNAQDYLYLAWRRNILDAKVMCGHRKSEGIIFSYIPFTSRVPVPWKRARLFPGIYEHPFTLLSLEYRENQTCESLSFDKEYDRRGYMKHVEGETMMKARKAKPLKPK